MVITKESKRVKEEFIELPQLSKSLDDLEGSIKNWHQESKHHEGDEDFLGYKNVKEATAAFEKELISYIQSIFKKLH